MVYTTQAHSCLTDVCQENEVTGFDLVTTHLFKRNAKRTYYACLGLFVVCLKFNSKKVARPLILRLSNPCHYPSNLFNPKREGF